MLMTALMLIGSTASAEDTRLTIRGKALEKGTRRHLEGITVYVLGNEVDSAVTEPDGSFVLETALQGDIYVAATGVGYARSAPCKIRRNPATTSPDILLYLEPVYSMMEVVVQGERNQDKTSRTIITGQELSKVAGSAGDPLRAMQALPGIIVANDTDSAPAIRGSGPDDNAYYVDFLPVGYLFHMGGMESVINADLVEDFNIYSSSFGPEYQDVTGGVLDIKLRKPRTDRLGAKVNIGMLETGALIEGPITPNQSFFLSARRSYIDLFLSKTKDSGVEFTQFPRYYDYQGKYIWNLSGDSSLTLQTSGAQDEMKLNLGNDADIVKHDPILGGNANSKTYYHTQGLVYRTRLTPRLSLTSGFSHMYSVMEQSMTQLGHANATNDLYYFRNHLKFMLGEQHELLAGVEAGLGRIKLDLDTTTAVPTEFNPNPDYTSSSRFVNKDSISTQWCDIALKDRWRLSGWATAVIGAHGSYETYFDKYMLEPRLALELTPAEKTLVTLGWGKYHQFPEGFQVIKGIGNPGLGYIKADHYSLGAEQKLAEGWSAKAEGYYKKFSDLVVPHEPENYINGGSGNAWGAELFIKKNRTQNWSGWLSASYSKSKRRNDVTGEKFPFSYDQPFVLNLVYDWNFLPKWTLGAKWRYQSGAPITPVTGTYTDSTGRLRPTYGPIGSDRLPDYHRLDIRLSRDFLFDRWKMSMYLDIINAYANQNVSGYEYNGDYSSRKKIQQLPFFPAIGIQGEF